MSGTSPDPGHFDRMADAYDRGRPPYPAALWEHLRALGVLGPGARVLELAAGTGIATGPMIESGASVTAVEPGPALAALIAHRYPDVDVWVSTAEEYTPPPAAYDLAAIATAVHWLDLGVVLPMLHRALAPEGHLAVWHTAYGDAEVPVTPFRSRIDEIVARRPEGRRPDPDDRERERRRTALEAGGYFRPVDSWSHHWTIELDPDRVRDLFASFSNWTEAEAEEARAAATDAAALDNTETVLEHYVTSLELLRRT